MDWIFELQEQYEARDIVIFGGLILGLAFGGLAQRSAFCFRKFLDDLAHRQIGAAAVMILAATAMAVLGTQYMLYATEAELEGVVYLTDSYSIVAIVIGGLLFGSGMVLSGGCTTRHMVLAAEGSARSWFVLLVLAVTAYMTLRGLFALARVEIELFGAVDQSDAETAWITLNDLVVTDIGYGAGIAIGLVLAVILGFAAWKKRHYSAAVYGLLIGLLVPLGWFLTSVVGYDEFEPVAAQAFSFVSPLANGLQYLMTYTGSTANYTIAILPGVLLGSFVVAVLTGKFAFRSFEKQNDILRYTAGAMMMGFGGVMALGCTIGQGLSGLSLLSFSSLLAVISISVGGYVTIVIRKSSKLPRRNAQDLPGNSAELPAE